MPIVRIRADIETNFFVPMIHLDSKVFVTETCFHASTGRPLLGRPGALNVCHRAGERVAVSTAISGREHGAVLLCGPAADSGMHGLAAFGCELTQVHSVTDVAVSGEYSFRVRFF